MYLLENVLVIHKTYGIGRVSGSLRDSRRQSDVRGWIVQKEYVIHDEGFVKSLSA